MPRSGSALGFDLLHWRVICRSMQIFFLIACAGHKTCEWETSEVSDSATELGDLDGSVSDLLDRASGTSSLPAAWSSGDLTTVELTLSRAAGSAAFDDGTLVGLVSPFWMNPIEVVCNDRVTVPVELRVRTEDGVLDVSGTTLLAGEATGAATEATLLAAILDDGSLVEDADDPAGWAWASFDDEGLSRVQVQLGEDESLDSVAE